MYIHEAETLRLVDAIGAHLYKQLDETDFDEEGPFTYIRPDGAEIEITKDQISEVFNGGYFDSPCASGKSEGLKTATSYFAYGRFLINNPINLTAFGTVYKNGEFSTKTDDNAMVRASSEARKIGEAYMKNCIGHLKSLGLLKCVVYKEGPRVSYRIGRRKL